MMAFRSGIHHLSPSFTKSPRSVRHSEVVIENVAAMYGAGFSAGNIDISVGHSVHSLYWGGVLKRMPAVSVFPNIHLRGGLLTLRATVLC